MRSMLGANQSAQLVENVSGWLASGPSLWMVSVSSAMFFMFPHSALCLCLLSVLLMTYLARFIFGLMECSYLTRWGRLLWLDGSGGAVFISHTSGLGIRLSRLYDVCFLLFVRVITCDIYIIKHDFWCIFKYKWFHFHACYHTYMYFSIIIWKVTIFSKML